MADQIQLKRDTSVRWTAKNPVLESGEIGIETDTNLIKIGDGSLQWNSLNYYMQKPVYTVAEANALTVLAGAECHISDEAGGYVSAFYDGSNWRRVTDRAIIS